MQKHNEANETMADEIQEHGHPPSAAEEAAEMVNARSNRSPAEINHAANEGHEKMRRQADARSNHPGEGIKEHALSIPSRTRPEKVEIGFGPNGGGLVPANPFASISQQHFLEAHPEKLKGKIGEWEKSTDYSKLPKKVKK